MSLFNLLEQSARHFPRSGAVYRGNTLVQSYSELRSRALRLATALLAEAAPGARVHLGSQPLRQRFGRGRELGLGSPEQIAEQASCHGVGEPPRVRLVRPRLLAHPVDVPAKEIIRGRVRLPRDRGARRGR